MFVLSLWSAIFPPKNGDDSDDSDDKNGPPTKELTSANRAEGKHTGEKGYEPVSVNYLNRLVFLRLRPFSRSSGDDSDDNATFSQFYYLKQG